VAYARRKFGKTWGAILRTIGIGLLAAVGVLGPTIAAAQNAAPQERQTAQPRQRRATQPRYQLAGEQRQAAPNWSGGQIGGSVGVSFVNAGFVEPGAHLCVAEVIAIPCVETPFSLGQATSATGGAFLGYRIQYGGMVYGIESDLNYKNASNSNVLYDANFFRAETFSGSIKETWDGSVRGRAGYLVTPWTLVYGTAGVAFGRVDGSFSYSAHDNVGDGDIAAGAGSWTDTRVGWTAGGGVETIIAAGLTLRLEYRYTDLGSYSKNVPLTTSCPLVPCQSPSFNSTINLHPTNNTVRVGVGLNF
jgi:outer membrane immunogenic protein